MSGIITALFCGILMRAYATPHLTVEGRLLASFLLKQIASLADLAVFLFIGIALVFIDSNGLIFGLVLMGFCVVGRIVAVVPLAVLTNGIKSAVGRSMPAATRHFISWTHMFMMCHAGLRGGIALVLVLDMGTWVDDLEGDGSRDVLRNGTLVVIVCFLLIFGGSTEMFLKLLGIRLGDQVDSNELLCKKDHQGRFMRGMRLLHERIVFPMLVGDHAKQVHMHGGVVQVVLDYSEEGPAKHVSKNNHMPGVLTGQVRSDLLDLFGTSDPAAAQEAIHTTTIAGGAADISTTDLVV
jgi:hypothetical protein